MRPGFGLPIGVLALLVGPVCLSPASADPRLPMTEASQTVLPSTRTGQINFESATREVTFDSNFPGGKIDELVEVDDDRFDLVIRPEIEPINDSAWYAFKVHAKDARHIKVRMKYRGGSHRYEPKISQDRLNWESAEHLVVARHPAGREITLRLPVGPEPVWVAGQELYGDRIVDDWVNQLKEHVNVTASTIGKSVKGLPIGSVEIAEGNPTDAIFILSRQHPPEVTGTIGMMSFVDQLLSDTPIAHEFQKEFRTVVVPIANPDGVRQGHWRTNANGVDMNRDWMHFTQPETASIRDEMLRLRAEGKLWLFLDFHSTYNEVFYTPPRETKLFPQGFTAEWLAAIDKRMPEFDVIRDDSHNAHRSTSKAWVARELGIHAITYEFGDETERKKIHEIARNSAEEMMRLLIQRKRNLAQTKPARGL